MKLMMSGLMPGGCRLVFVVLIGLALVLVHAAELPGLAEVNKALAKAKAEKKTVLLHFTGIGWCSECQSLREEVIKSTGFANYAATNFVIVEVAVSAEQESALAERYGVSGWPALVLLDAQGNAVDKVTGYGKGNGAEAVIQEIEMRRKRIGP